MSQKFISLDDAATRLGLSKERLNQLREAGDLRAYRDGASWKFRTEEIEKLEAEGVPSEGGDDDLALGGESDLALAMPGDDGPPTPDPAAASGGDDLELDDDMIDLSVEPLGDGDDAESILLTGDQELEGGMPHPQSTIIGKSELSLEDDLELAAASDVVGSEPTEPPAAGGSFDDIEELELDLDGEASRVSNADDASAAATSDLELEELDLDLAGSGAGSDILNAGGDDDANPSLSGSVSGLSGLDAIDLAADEDDDLVLGGSDDSGDLASSDSGINLSPSESGFALDEVALDLGGGSAIGSQLDLAALSAASSSPANAGSASSGLGGEDFQLTPSDDADDDEEDSSQIVALEEISEEEEELPEFDAADDDDAGGFDDGFSGGGLGGETSAAPVAVAAAEETPFPGWIVGILGASMFTMLLCGLMAMDLVQSMWAWDEPFSFNSPLIEGLAGIFGG